MTTQVSIVSEVLEWLREVHGAVARYRDNRGLTDVSLTLHLADGDEIPVAGFGVGPAGMLCVAVEPEHEGMLLDRGPNPADANARERLAPRVVEVPLSMITRIELSPGRADEVGFTMDEPG